MLDPSQWIITEHTHEPIIARDDFMKVQESLRNGRESMLKARNDAAKINAMYPDELKGLLYCGECGSRMRIDRWPHGSKEKVKTIVYECRNPKGVKKCEGHVVMGNLMKMLIMDQIHETVSKYCDKDKLWEATEGIRSEDDPIRKTESDIKRAKAKISGIADKRSTLYENLSKGVIDQDEFRLLQDTYKKQQEEAEGELKNLEDKKAELEKELKEYLKSADMLKKYVSVRAFDEELVRELVSRVDVFPDKHIHVTYKFKDIFEDRSEASDSNI